MESHLNEDQMIDEKGLGKASVEVGEAINEDANVKVENENVSSDRNNGISEEVGDANGNDDGGSDGDAGGNKKGDINGEKDFNSRGNSNANVNSDIEVNDNPDEILNANETKDNDKKNIEKDDETKDDELKQNEHKSNIKDDTKERSKPNHRRGHSSPVGFTDYEYKIEYSDYKGTTSFETGKQLQEKSEFFNRDQGKMFIGGLNWDTTEASLESYFSQFGEIVDLTIMRDGLSGRSRGFGFLTFKEAESVEKVLQQHHVLDGKVIDPKRAIPKEEQDKTGKIFVGGVAPEVTEHDFDDFFSQFGNVIDAQLMIDKDSRRSRGFGFVTFDSPEAVDSVTRNHYLELKGKKMEIKRAEPRIQQIPGFRRMNRNRRQNPQYGQYNYVPMPNPYSMIQPGQYWQWPVAQQAQPPLQGLPLQSPPLSQPMGQYMMPRSYGEPSEPVPGQNYEANRRVYDNFGN